MRRLLLLLAALLTVSAGSGAQATGTAVTPKPRGRGMEVRQYTLQVLTGSEAESLLVPFVPVGDGGGVWRSSGTVLTVIGTKRTLALADSVLKSYDRPPVTLVLRFMLIEATDSAVTDPRIGEVEGELRSLLKFNGYRRLAEATSVVAETQNFTSTMAAADRTEFTVDGGVKTVRDGRVGIGISLRSGTKGMMIGVPTSPDTRQLLSTTLTVPVGQTVVLGTAAGDKGMVALILTVKPELAEFTARQSAAPQGSERTYEFKIHSGAASFDGILRVLGDSMEVEPQHGYCVAELGQSSSEVKHFKCWGLLGVENLVLAFDVQNFRESSHWWGTVNEEQTNGPHKCVQYRGGVCVEWRPTVGDFKKSVRDRIVLTPKPL
ncbi:MAG TPA: hypothetical protein VIK25_07385 [Gemmatimonadaceae bacterium]